MAGFRELLAVEWDDNAVATFKLNFPDVPVYHGDIGKLSVVKCLELAGLEPGQLDVLDGSPPCQGFSTAGKREFTDDRNQLFREFVRLLQGLQPRVFVMENVSGMVKGKMKLIFADILRELKDSGYKVSVRLLNAMYFGVPQSRQRLIFVGVREDLGAEPSHPKAEKAKLSCHVALSEWKLVCRLDYGGDLQEQWKRTSYDRSVSNGQADYKLNPTRPAHTVRKNGSLWHYSRPYPLNSRGYSRLGSFPDGFQWVRSQAAIQERIGNSVPPLMMRSIARHIRRVILTNGTPELME